ncbi:hypothetical protein KC330_g159 [Hortaea werneckii]|nr:hypothetical protein KC330_g159 [Hortaea werneckii]
MEGRITVREVDGAPHRFAMAANFHSILRTIARNGNADTVTVTPKRSWRTYNLHFTAVAVDLLARTNIGRGGVAT